MKTITKSSASNLRTCISTLAVLVLPLATMAQPNTNRVLSLNASGDYMTVPTAPDLQNADAITIEAWLNPATIQPQEWLISKSDGNSARSYEIEWIGPLSGWGTTNGVEVDLFLGSGAISASQWMTLAAHLPQSGWHHIAASYRKDLGLFALYTNGVIAASTTVAADGLTPLAGRPLRQTTLPVTLGWATDAELDEVRIWNTARTPGEIYRDRFCRLTGTESNLVAYWTFDDGTGSDQTGHGHDGMLAGNAQAETISTNDAVHSGPCGALPQNSVLWLDGSGDYMSVPSALELQTPTEIAVEFWMNPQPLNQYPVFLGKSDGQSVNSARSYEFDWPSNGVLGVQFFWQAQPGKPDFSALYAPLPSNQWTHVAAVFSSELGVFQVFINGALAGQESDLTGRTLRQTSLPLVLGWVSPFTYTYASGGMDEVRIWNKARTADEIYRDRFCRLTGTESNLVAYWTFDDGSATDQTGRGHNGTFAGNAQVQVITGSDDVHAGVCGATPSSFRLSDDTPGGGLVVPDPLMSSYPAYAFVTLTATPANGWTFLDWKGSAQGTNPTTTLQIDCEKVVQARFGTPITLTASGSGAANLFPASTLYPYGTAVLLIAQPQAGSQFAGWSGAASGDVNPRSFAVSDAHPVILASFTPLAAGRHALTVIPDGGGRVSLTPRANSYTNGQSVTLRATPDVGQDFIGWSGDANGTTNPLVLTMNQSKTITASFTKRPSLFIQHMSCDGMLVTLAGEFGGSYRIESSLSLSNWTDWLAVTNSYGLTQVYDPLAANTATRFFRATVMDTNVPIGMSLIPGGSFQMGDTFNEGEGDEFPVHPVTVSGFYMDNYEVTKALWDDVFQWATNHGYSFDGGALGKAANHPAQFMTWYDAVKWCNARSEMAGLIPAYYTTAGQTAVYRAGQVDVRSEWVKWTNGYRLPTEAEWEKAARGRSTGQRFPWGDIIAHSNANYFSTNSYAYDLSPTRGFQPAYNDGTYPYTSPVGSFSANAYGLFDMAGNVWEWCWDWRDGSNYGASSGSDPHGPASGVGRSLRGGSWWVIASRCRSADRENHQPEGRESQFGFRCVLPKVP